MNSLAGDLLRGLDCPACTFWQGRWRVLEHYAGTPEPNVPPARPGCRRCALEPVAYVLIELPLPRTSDDLDGDALPFH